MAKTSQRTLHEQRDQRSTQELRRIRNRIQTRNNLANVVTIVMLLLTLAVLGWVAYQINHPVVLLLSSLGK